MKNDSMTNIIRVRVNYNLIQEIKEKIKNAHSLEDFTFLSLTDFNRKALIAYKNGMKLNYEFNKSPKQLIAIGLDKNLYEFYLNLPEGKRTELIERSIGTYFKEHFKQL